MPEFVVQPRVSGVKPEHPAALRAAEELREDLHGVSGCSVEERQSLTDGAKGTVTDLVLALGGPAVVGGVVAVFRVWLQRDARDRSLVVRRVAHGNQIFVEIQGTQVSDQTIREALDRVLQEGEETGPSTCQTSNLSLNPPVRFVSTG